MSVRRKIRVNNHSRASTRAVALLFLVSAPLLYAVPVVGSFSPTQGRPGNQIVITGSGFSSATLVQFGVAPGDFIVSSDTRMTATVPSDATTGPISVTSTSGTGASSATFLVAPRISGFSPARGATNTVVLIEGFNFSGATNVLFNDKRAAFAVTAPIQIQATVPTGATNGPITVQTPAGTAMTTDSFIVTGPAPIVDGFSPGVGAPWAGVLIYGANFNNPVTVKFNGVSDSTATVTAPTQISAHVPSAATTGRISVATAGGATTNANTFFVTRAPVITSFFPGRGQTNYTRVTIEGVNFSGVTGVGFNGKSVAGFSLPAANQIAVNVPAGATTGRITVTNSFGVGTSTNDFIITKAPIIDSFNPMGGAPGAPVTISGVNLSNGPTVLKFNGVNAAFTVTGQNGIQVQATVPSGATTGPITMTNAFGSFTTSSYFFVPGSAPYIDSLDPGAAPRGTRILITGGNFSNLLSVKFNGVPNTNASASAPTQIQATVPATATTGPLTVTTSSGTSTNNPIFYLPPRLAGFSPTTGVVGSSVVISGANFTNTGTVLFNTAGSSFTVTAPGSISAVIPTNATTGPLTVTTPGGVIISTNNFRVLPNITSFSPALGPAGTLVTILGTSFFGVTNVSFNNVVAASITGVSPTEVHATVPPAATTGPIRVSTPDGTAVSATNFLVTRSSDLGLAMAASATLLKPGQPLTYSLLVTNKGPSIVTGVILTNTLPAGVVLLSTGLSRGTCTVAGRIVTCSIGILTNGTGESALITVAVPNEAVLTNTAVVASAESDLNSIDNRASIVTTVVSDATRTLGIRLAAGSETVMISWPTSAVSFTLQFLDALSPPNFWLPVTNTPAIVSGHNTVTNDASKGNRFFRLQRP